MRYTTFENRKVDTDKMDQQHLSNVYWFQKLINGIDCHKEILAQLNNRFDGKILPYRPMPKFRSEIDSLDRLGYLVWKDIDGFTIADIVYKGEIIGSACYTEQIRDILINEIING